MTSDDRERATTQDAVICLVCGGAYRQLTTRHLRLHGLTSDAYRVRFGLSPDHPLVCLGLQQRYRALAAARRDAERVRQRALLTASRRRKPC
jgi:predicted transcriptional regulator